MRQLIPDSWAEVLKSEFDKPYFRQLETYIYHQRINNTVYPPHEETFKAFDLTPYEKVRVVILGQDPYHDRSQAHGLAFSVKDGVKLPMSLINIYRELKDDLGIQPSENGNLTPWTQQGVFLLNTVLTVRSHKPNSHKEQGWEVFTNAVIEAINKKTTPVIFVFWGKKAAVKKELIDRRHRILISSHPSPMAARKGFFGSKPFSKINGILGEFGQEEINWRIS